MTIDTILFDLDGTLLNTLDDLAASGNFALQSSGFPTHPVAAYREFVGNGVDVLMRRILPPDRLDEKTIASLKRIYLDYYRRHSLDETKPYPGVTAMLAKLADAGIKMAVISNKPEEDTVVTVSHFFAPGLFACVTGGRSDRPLKPHPAIAAEAMATMDSIPARTALCGDTKIDMQCAKNACCYAVGVSWGFRSPEELRGNGADRIIDTPDELAAILYQI